MGTQEKKVLWLTILSICWGAIVILCDFEEPIIAMGFLSLMIVTPVIILHR